MSSSPGEQYPAARQAPNRGDEAAHPLGTLPLDCGAGCNLIFMHGTSRSLEGYRAGPLPIAVRSTKPCSLASDHAAIMIYAHARLAELEQPNAISQPILVSPRSSTHHAALFQHYLSRRPCASWVPSKSLAVCGHYST